MREDLRAAYNAAYDKASKELDTWCCPECGYEVQFPGNVHIEWGNPECNDCHDQRGKKVLLRLGAIEPADRPTPKQSEDADGS